MKKHRLMNHQKYFRTLCFRAVVPHSGVHQRIASEHGTGRMAENQHFHTGNSRHEGRQRTGNSRRQRNNHPCRR